MLRPLPVGLRRPARQHTRGRAGKAVGVLAGQGLKVPEGHGAPGASPVVPALPTASGGTPGCGQARQTQPHRHCGSGPRARSYAAAHLEQRTDLPFAVAAGLGEALAVGLGMIWASCSLALSCEGELPLKTVPHAPSPTLTPAICTSSSSPEHVLGW